MKHFKHLNHGMSLIEVTMAIAILAFFGTSIFITQQYLFDRMMVVQKKLTANLRMQAELAAYQINILQEFFEQKGPLKKSLEKVEKVYSNPDMTVTISTKSDFTSQQEDKESAFQRFKNLYLITVQAEENSSALPVGTKKNYGTSYYLMYIPEVIKK